jgi:ferritin-like metal-binding protein YciE
MTTAYEVRFQWLPGAEPRAPPPIPEARIFMPDHDKSQNQNQNTIADYVGDMVALQNHIEEALDHQLEMSQDMPIAYAAIKRFHDTVKSQRDAMRAHQEQTGETAGSPIKEAGAAIIGKAAGLIDKVRTEGISKALRDDYTAFNHASIGFTMLHATATALGDKATARIAREGLTAYAKMVQEINHLIADVVIEELRRDDHKIVDMQAAQQNRAMVDTAWRETSNPDVSTLTGGFGGSEAATGI